MTLLLLLLCLQCSVTCGVGSREPAYACMVDTRTVSQDYCDPQQRPTMTKRCKERACPVWETGEWERVSSTTYSGPAPAPAASSQHLHCAQPVLSSPNS